MPNAMSLSERRGQCQGSMKERGHPVRKRAEHARFFALLITRFNGVSCGRVLHIKGVKRPKGSVTARQLIVVICAYLVELAYYAKAFRRCPLNPWTTVM